MRWAGHVVCMGDIRNVYIILAINMKGRDHLEDLGTEGKILLEWILGKYGGKVWTGFG
jgi:hypothetical protein